MFDTLTDRLGGIFDRMRGKGRLSEADVDASLREIRLALLEADVNVVVARDLLNRVKERAVGAEVTKSLTPGQQVVKIVNEELVATLGTEPARLSMAPSPPTVILMVGLQGSGKTTSAAKLSRHLVRQGKQPMLVAADLQRPAAIEQLQTLGERAGVPGVHRPHPATRPSRQGGPQGGNRLGRDVVVVDTAGRLQIDRQLMGELSDLDKASNPTETLLVVDAMTGQDAVNVAKGFLEYVDLTGIVLSKLDGDARGGAAISVREVTGSPIKFAGVGEKLDDFEVFHPDRMASRILGHGRCAHPDREGGADLGCPAGREARRQDEDRQLHLRRLPRSVPAGEDGWGRSTRWLLCFPAPGPSSAMSRFRTATWDGSRRSSDR